MTKPIGAVCGNPHAAQELIAELETELREIAARVMRQERVDHTLQPTALVNEAYFRLIQQRNLSNAGRLEFLRAAATIMRRILVDHARKIRRRRSLEHHGGASFTLSGLGAQASSGSQPIDLLTLDETMTKLARHDPRLARIVECRVFGGMSHEDIAKDLDLSVSLIQKQWSFAKSWLAREMRLPSGGRR